MASINQQIHPYIRAVSYIAHFGHPNITFRTLFLLYLFYMSVVVNKIEKYNKKQSLENWITDNFQISRVLNISYQRTISIFVVLLFNQRARMDE